MVGKTKQAGVTFTLHKAPGRVQGPAPFLGQHTDEVLGSVNGAEGNRAQTRRAAMAARRHALEGVEVLDFGNFLAGRSGRWC